ncbi:MAG: hypothetical protein AB7O43_08730 [Hyphomicrobiaceae bacterium]
MSKQLPAILDGLAAAGFIEQRIGDASKFPLVFTEEFGERRERRPTTITPGPALLEELPHLAFTDFGECAKRELIVLRGPHLDHWTRGKLIDYADTPITEGWRRDLVVINAWLRGLDIVLVDAPHIDTGERRLHRVFSRGRFDSGGRLAGGFWLRLPKALRPNLRIAGEPIAVVDFTSMFPRMCFALAGEPQPAGDIYAIAGLGAHHRGAVKALVAARLFDTGPRTRWPKRKKGDVRSGRPRPPMPVGAVLAAIEAAHPTLARHFGRGLGHHLMFLESEIILRVLRGAIAAGVPLLPLHDAVLCPVSKTQEGAALMKEASEIVLGGQLPVSIELTTHHDQQPTNTQREHPPPLLRGIWGP